KRVRVSVTNVPPESVDELSNTSTIRSGSQRVLARRWKSTLVLAYTQTAGNAGALNGIKADIVLPSLPNMAGVRLHHLLPRLARERLLEFPPILPQHNHAIHSPRNQVR